MRTFPDHHHLLRSLLENLEYLDMVLDIPLDPMHLIDIGVTNRLLKYYFIGIKKGARISGITLSRAIIEEIDDFLLFMRK